MHTADPRFDPGHPIGFRSTVGYDPKQTYKIDFGGAV